MAVEKASIVKAGAFKVLDVPKRMPLKTLLTSKKLKFEKGRAFYQLTKGEIIQDYKKVVVMRNDDNAFIIGDAVRIK